MVCIDGEPGGVAEGLWGVDRPARGSFGLDRGEVLGLPLKLAFLLTKKKIVKQERKDKTTCTHTHIYTHLIKSN